MIDTTAIAGGKKIFAMAAISMLPVFTPILAISQEIMPETTRMIMAVSLEKEGVVKLDDYGGNLQIWI
jgi:hypothetical protein